MALSNASVNKIKSLLAKNKKSEAETLLRNEAGLSQQMATEYVNRLSEAVIKKDDTKGCINFNFIAYIFFGLGMILWGLAVYFYVQNTSKINTSSLVTGVVVGLDGEEQAKAPIISYEIDGKPYQYTGLLRSYPPDFVLDEEVELYVSNDNPNDIIINSFGNKWLLPIIFGSIGLFFDLMGIIGIIILRNLKRTIMGKVLDELFSSEVKSM